HLSAELDMIEADRDRYRQICINLVGNAIKYTETGIITVSTALKDGNAVLTVTDTGRGIPANRIDTIFTPFTQVDNINTRTEGGVGLGLAIVKQLIDAHKGTITVKSTAGIGSTFTVMLPVKSDYPCTERPVQDSGIETQIFKRIEMPPKTVKEETVIADDSIIILAVDDDPVNLHALEGIFYPAGYVVITAQDAESAQRKMKAVQPNLILLDLMLPGISGFEACPILRAESSRPYLPIIIMTAKGESQTDIIQSFKSGANDYVAKPFNAEELLNRIENQLAIQTMFEIERCFSRSPETARKIQSLVEGSVELKKQTLKLIEWEREISRDLDRSGAFQQKLMSSSNTIDGIRFATYYRPLLTIGGDMFDIVEVRPGVTRILIADATGHGISASLTAVKILTEYAAVRSSYQSPVEVVENINARFQELFSESRIIFSGVVADIDRNTDTVSIVSCGHPEQYVISGSEITVIEPKGGVFGFNRQGTYRTVGLPFLPGDRLVLFTDGIFQLFPFQTPVQQELSLIQSEQVKLILKDSAGVTPEEMVRKLIESMKDQAPNQSPEDDVTLLCLTRTE
ncbi:MAG: SpoIIE family protein phosphatase, partial [Spirochaetota bacterium]